MTTPARPTISRAQLRAAYDALGLDPDRWDDTTEVRITPSFVMVYRALRPGPPRTLAADEVTYADSDGTTIEAIPVANGSGAKVEFKPVLR